MCECDVVKANLKMTGLLDTCFAEISGTICTMINSQHHLRAALPMVQCTLSTTGPSVGSRIWPDTLLIFNGHKTIMIQERTMY